MKKTKYLTTGIILIIVCLSLVQITVSNMLSTDGIGLNKIETQVEALQKENAQLREQVYAASSLTTISEQAEKLGFVPDKMRLVISSPLPLAIKQ